MKCMANSVVTEIESRGAFRRSVTNHQTTTTAELQDVQPASPSHVLAVDDDATVRALITEYLGQYEFRVTAVTDGRAMQEVLAEQVVELILLDLKLKGEEGMTLARRLRDKSAIPIIM